MLLVKRAARLSWITVALLAASCCVLAVFQYRWISEFTEAERHRLATDLESRLNLLARGFNQQISRAFSALIPAPFRVDAVGPEKAYAAAYENSRASRLPAFRRIALVTRTENGLAFRNLDLETGRFSPSAWPAAWSRLRERLETRADHRRAPPLDSDSPPLLEAHSFSEAGENWLIAELDVAYVREKMLPPLLNRFLRISGKLDYDWDLAAGNTSLTTTADASVDLLDTDFGPHDPPHGPGPGRGPVRLRMAQALASTWRMQPAGPSILRPISSTPPGVFWFAITADRSKPSWPRPNGATSPPPRDCSC